MAPVTTSSLRKMKSAGERFASLTAYDASFAALIEAAGVEVVLVGDSLGNVVQGHDSTLPVTVEEMVYHTRNVRRGVRDALLVADMPFLSFADPATAVATAGRLMKEGGAQMVKLEGGTPVLETVHRLTSLGVPVCAHLGLLPQSVHKVGGYRVQGREAADAQRILGEARELEQAGADMLVLECVPRPLAAEITRSVAMPVVGIGAGPECDGQVLVLYDMLGITPGKRPKFSKDYLGETGSIPAALAAYVREVKAGVFPGPEQCFD